MRISSVLNLKRLTLTSVAVFVTTVYARAQGPSFEPVAPPQTAEISFHSPVLSLPAVHELNSSEIAFAAPMPIIESTAAMKKGRTMHRFWDRENRVLFAATGLAAMGDFFVTHANLSSGGRELDPVARLFTGSTPALACNFALQTTAVIGASYLFHKTGHHRLERLTSVVTVTASSSAVAYGLTHR